MPDSAPRKEKAKEMGGHSQEVDGRSRTTRKEDTVEERKEKEANEKEG